MPPDKGTIRLAKAMKLEIHSRGGDTYPLRKMRNNLMQPFSPFTDANDDYAVLEWMREHLSLPKQQKLLWHQSSYNIGDYARAALKVLSPTETEDG